MMKKLTSVIKNISDYNPDLVICAKEPWDAESECVVIELRDDDTVPSLIREGDFNYFLEVFLAQEIIEDFKERLPAGYNAVDLLIYYASNDAFPSWVLP